MFYNKNEIFVDATRYNVKGKTFPINTISSVCAYKYKNYLLAISGVILILMGLIDIKFNVFHLRPEILGYIFLILGIPMFFLNLLPKYAVRITTAAGKSDSYVSIKKKEILKIVDAINEAIIKRG